MNSSFDEIRCDLLELINCAKSATDALNELSLLISGRLIDQDSKTILKDSAAQLNNCRTKTDSPRQKIIERPSTSTIVESSHNLPSTTRDKPPALKSNRVPLFPAPKIVTLPQAIGSIAVENFQSSNNASKQQISDHGDIVDNPPLINPKCSSKKRRASQGFGEGDAMKNNQMQTNIGASKNHIPNEKINSPTLTNGTTAPHSQRRLSSLETSAAYSRHTKQAIVLETVPRPAQIPKRRKAF